MRLGGEDSTTQVSFCIVKKSEKFLFFIIGVSGAKYSAIEKSAETFNVMLLRSGVFQSLICKIQTTPFYFPRRGDRKFSEEIFGITLSRSHIVTFLD